jgi:hypothetical protein
MGHGRVNLNQALIHVPEPAQSLQLATGVGLLVLLACARSQEQCRRARALLAMKR